MGSRFIPEVSVIVPIFNTEAYLERCVMSLLNQRAVALEIILVDDCSPDQAGVIAEQLFLSYPEQIRCIRLRQNVGLAQARNIGMTQARGEYIGFVDSDDFVDPDCYRRLRDALNLQQRQWAYCAFAKFNSHALIEVRPLDLRENTSACNKLFRAELLRRQGIEFAVGELFEDEIFSYRVALAGGAPAVVDDALYFYRINPAGICRRAGAEAVRHRYFGRLSASYAFIRQLRASDWQPQAQRASTALLCRHAMQMLTQPISWLELQAFWRSISHLIDKYRLPLADATLAEDYFVQRFRRLSRSPLRLWLLQQWLRRRYVAEQ